MLTNVKRTASVILCFLLLFTFAGCKKILPTILNTVLSIFMKAAKIRTAAQIHQAVQKQAAAKPAVKQAVSQQQAGAITAPAKPLRMLSRAQRI